MHWQYKSYNYGFERFFRMLEKYPKTSFIGHAPTWWAHIDANYVDDEKNLYPTGKVKPGGLTDRYLADYPNCYGDLSAASGRNAFRRNENGTSFIERHQDKLVFGSDCTDAVGRGGQCTGAMQIAQLRALAPSKAVERKLLYENARKLFRF
jgi:predicted TIM-barrel fold metal-dependent hydrolase